MVWVVSDVDDRVLLQHLNELLKLLELSLDLSLPLPLEECVCEQGLPLVNLIH